MDYRQMIGFITGKPSRHPYPIHMQQARRIASEGMVLLKNDHDVLPLKERKAALFGAGAVDTISCGTGSGFVFAPYTITVEKGLQNAGIEITSKSWLKRFAAASKKANKEDKTLSKIDRMWSGLSILIDELDITDAELSEAKAADTAVYVIRRNSGEGGDRKAVKGDYYLSDTETANLKKVAASFSHTIVVLNSCVVDANFIYEIDGIDAALLMGQAGNEGGNALADVLTGKVNPCGRLTDTWAKQYSDNPASASFSENDGNSLQEDYTEDIFVGYRYFDTFDKDVIYPFGYGLSYTTFEKTVKQVTADWNQVTVSVEVTNTGKLAGKDVVEVYITAPEGRLTKPSHELKGYAKTALIAPNQSETVTVSIPTESLASFDTAKAAFVMETGDYIVRVGNNSRDTNAVQIIRLDAEAVVRQVRNEFAPDHVIDTLKAPARKPESYDCPVLLLSAADCITIDGACKTTEVENVNGKRFAQISPADSATLVDVKEGRISMDAFVASLDDDVLLRLVAGNANETPYEVPSRMSRKVKPVKAPSSSGATTSLFVKSLGIPNWLVTDGPAGLHLPLCGATCYPVGMVLAQTWDDAAVEEMGVGVGKELKYYNYSIILGPGMNIHRDPLCGRNFEYYSEDPLISGKMAAAATKGVQKTPGAGVSIKHFACNNQEGNRLDCNSTVSERALREIYLRGFEICVRESNPKTVMTSYNLINGVHTSSNYNLLTEVLRGEWGFQGLVMTDWGTKSVKPYDLHAGNDLIMGGYRSQFLMSALTGAQPEFMADGYVKEETFKVFGGFFNETVEYWNSFEPDKDGADTVSTTIAAGCEPHTKIADKIKEGIAEITEHEDGSKTVTYHGTNRGAYLRREDVQACAARVLEQIMNSISYDVMIK